MLKAFLSRNLFLILAFLLVFLGGWQVGYAGFQLNLRLNPPQLRVENKAPPSQTINFSILWDAIDRINKDFLFKPVDAKKLLYGAVSGLVQALGDPYTSFLTPDQNETFTRSLEGVYEGIGAELGIRNDQLIIVAPLDGSPAKEAGIRGGDKILEIDGVATSGITIAEAVSKIRGGAGTKVTLTLQRGTDLDFKVTITRAKITVKSIRWEAKGNGVLYLKVSRFGESTNAEWDSAVGEIKNTNIKGIVLDLRDNPGGYLSAAVYLASEFLTSGTVVIQEDASGGRQTLSAQETQNNHAFTGVPVVVLINGGSASASEILAAALSERLGIKLVGEKSFGKGTVQDAVNFEDGSGLHLTIAKWLTPRANWVNEVGLTPNAVVDLTDEDLNAGRDPQLDRALEFLR